MLFVNSDRGVGSGGAVNWFLQRVTGAFLLLALLTHFWVLHFFPSHHGEITFNSVMERLQNPAWKAFDLLFLVCALYHALNGATLVVHDYVHRPGWRVFILGVLWLAATWFLILGTMTIMGLKTGGLG